MRLSRTSKALGLILLGSFLIKLLLILLLKDLQPYFDEREYVRLAKSLVNGTGFLGSPKRPPLYPLFLAFFFSCFGPSLVAARIGQALLSLLSGILVYRIGKLSFGRACGLAAAQSSLAHFLADRYLNSAVL